ncbi:hypothetical protein BN2537_2071 [Streptomyces venezuelae]|nr:hypothetical protein BN2537_2071 [Streptomyces venezuelae]
MSATGGADRPQRPSPRAYTHPLAATSNSATTVAISGPLPKRLRRGGGSGGV